VYTFVFVRVFVCTSLHKYVQSHALSIRAAELYGNHKPSSPEPDECNLGPKPSTIGVTLYGQPLRVARPHDYVAPPSAEQLQAALAAAGQAGSTAAVQVKSIRPFEGLGLGVCSWGGGIAVWGLGFRV
jgi:hypothetical protein